MYDGKTLKIYLLPDIVNIIGVFFTNLEILDLLWN